MIKSFELSKNTNLESIYCNDRELKSLDVHKNTKLKDLRCYLSKLSTLDFKYNTELTNLSFAISSSTPIDLSSLTALTYLEYVVSSSTIDVRANKALTTLHVYSSRLTELDVSMNTELISLECGYAQLTKLDLSKNTKLKELICPQNKLTSLTVNSKLENIDCSRNHLPLSDLFVCSEMTPDIADSSLKRLGPQSLLPRTAAIGEELDFSDQSLFKDIQTQFVVKTGGILYEDYFILEGATVASPSDYSLIDGKIKFNRAGTYRVFMTNEAITSFIINPAEVFVQITVH